MPETPLSAASPPTASDAGSVPAYQVVDRPAQPFVGVTRPVTMATLKEAADEVPRLLGWLSERGLTPAGAPFLRYLVIDMAATMVVQAGVPVAEPVVASVPDGDVEDDTLPAGSYVTTTHVGPYDGLYNATAALLTWAGEQGLHFDKSPSPSGEAWASRVERYETDPVAEPDPARWVTRLTFKLAD